MIHRCLCRSQNISSEHFSFLNLELQTPISVWLKNKRNIQRQSCYCNKVIWNLKLKTRFCISQSRWQICFAKFTRTKIMINSWKRKSGKPRDTGWIIALMRNSWDFFSQLHPLWFVCDETLSLVQLWPRGVYKSCVMLPSHGAWERPYQLFSVSCFSLR